MDAAGEAVSPRREAIRTAALRIAVALLMVAFVGQLIDRKPPYFTRPSTIIDHSVYEGDSRPRVLRLMNRARAVVPRGSSVACFRPADGRAHDEALTYLTAVGLLDEQRVVPALTASEDSGEPPDYVVAIEKPFTHPSYQEVAAFAEGRVYRRNR